MIVATVLKSGGDYGVRDVAAIATGVRKHLPGTYDFVCLTDLTFELPNVRTVPLTHNLPGWWSKLELFLLPGPLLYLDLDTVVVGELTNLVTRIKHLNSEMLVLRDFYHCGIASGVLGWSDQSRIAHQNRAEILEKFIAMVLEPAARFRGIRGVHQFVRADGHIYHGDQNYIEDEIKRREMSYVSGQDIGGIYSYKKHIRQNKGQQVPADAALICFHGRPRPRDVSQALRWMQGWEVHA